jgi:nitroimidazol reductase NimA-like FMN-containing flavoprotein (pyridoxamine 5'-phosphate oxidase superfamily)
MTTGDGPATYDGGKDINLESLVRTVVDDNVYMVLGTADAAGRPWASPVFYAADGHRDFYWISSPEVTHSRNVAVRPDVSIVVFDSRAPVGTGDSSAVYMTATAAEVPADELDQTLGPTLVVHQTFAERGGRQLAPADLRPPAPYRLYRATVSEHSVICPRPAGTPCAVHGLDYDHRTQVRLP